MLIEIVPELAKTTPYPPFPASDALYPDSGFESPAEMRRVTLTNFTGGPLGVRVCQPDNKFF